MKYDQYVTLVENINALFEHVDILQYRLELLGEEQFKMAVEPTFLLLFKNSSYASAVAELLDVYESPYLLVEGGRGISCDLAGELTSLATILNDAKLVDVLSTAIKKVSFERLKITFDAMLMKNFPLVVANKALIGVYMKHSQAMLGEQAIHKVINEVDKWDKFYYACAENNTRFIHKMLNIRPIQVPCVASVAIPAIMIPAAAAAVPLPSTKVKGAVSYVSFDKENTTPTINRRKSL